MSYKEYIEEKTEEAKRQGLEVVYVGAKELHDYAAMNPEAGEAMGHPCPKDKIQVQSVMGDRKTYETLNHELIEAQLMKHGWEYWPAHQFALKYEAALPGELKIVKVHNDGDLTIDYKGTRHIVALDTKNKTFSQYKEEGMKKPTDDENSLPLAPAGRSSWGRPFQKKELTPAEIAKRREEHIEAQRAYSRTLAWNRYRMGNGPKPTEPEYPEKETTMSKTHPGFEKVAKEISERQNIPIEKARAILAQQTRRASPQARRFNPHLNRVSGAMPRISHNDGQISPHNGRLE